MKVTELSHAFLLQVCVFTAPLFSAFCALTTYFLAKEIRGQGAGLFAALFAASVPSYISRSVAGSYDNEGVAIFALVLVFFLYVKVRHHGMLFCQSWQELLHTLPTLHVVLHDNTVSFTLLPETIVGHATVHVHPMPQCVVS